MKTIKLTNDDFKKLVKRIIEIQVNKIENMEIDLANLEIVSSKLQNDEEVVYELEVEKKIGEPQKNKTLKEKIINFIQNVKLSHIVATLCVPVGVIITKESTNAFGYFFGLPLGLLYSLMVTMLSMKLTKVVYDMGDFKN